MDWVVDGFCKILLFLHLKVLVGHLPTIKRKVQHCILEHAGIAYSMMEGLIGGAPAYHRKEVATLHPGACRHSLQYDGRPDWCFGVRVGTWNLGNLSGKGGEVCEELRNRMNDMCCL